MRRSEAKVKVYARSEGYAEVLAAVSGLVKPRHLRPYLDGDGWPTEKLVAGVLRLLKESAPSVSRRKRWVEAALWQRAHEGEEAA